MFNKNNKYTVWLAAWLDLDGVVDQNGYFYWLPFMSNFTLLDVNRDAVNAVGFL